MGINIPVDTRVAIFGSSGNGKTNFTKGAFKLVSPLFVHNPQEEEFPACENYFDFDSLYKVFRQRQKRKAKTHRYALVTEKIADVEKLSTLAWELQNCTLLLDEVLKVCVRGKTPDHVMLIARRGRRRNIRLILTNQRPANTDTDVVSQCNHYFVFRVTYPADVKYISDLIPQFRDYNNQIPKFGFLYWNTEMAGPRICNPVPWVYPSSNKPRPVEAKSQ